MYSTTIYSSTSTPPPPPRQSLLSHIIPQTVQPSSPRPSSPHPPPLYFNSHRPTSHIVLLSPHHMPLPCQLPFLIFSEISPTFVVPLIISLLILSSLVTPFTHRCIHISAAANLSSCAFFTVRVTAPYTSADLTTVLHTFPFIFT